jgi:hypothetical protein
MREEIKELFNPENAYYHSVQNISSRLLSKNRHIKICEIVLLPVVSVDVKFGLSH